MSERLTEQSKITYTDCVQLPGGNTYVLTDKNVKRLYPSVLADYVIEPGEDAKCLGEVERICLDMVRKGCDRKTRLVAVGGGVVGDLGGFIAACYMRGIEWINVPTTILAQVDSSVGGKTAVDLGGYKNIIGAFHLPTEVIISSEWLATLPERERVCGEGEIFKTALLDERVHALYAPNMVNSEIIRACIEFKSRVVAADFKESGLRKILNAGHTLGHALEKEDSHVRSHGEYVAMGLQLESFLFRDMIDRDFYDYIQENAARIAKVIPFDLHTIATAAQADKKNSGGKIAFIVTEGVGRTSEQSWDARQVERGLREWK